MTTRHTIRGSGNYDLTVEKSHVAETGKVFLSTFDRHPARAHHPGAHVSLPEVIQALHKAMPEDFIAAVKETLPASMFAPPPAERAKVDFDTSAAESFVCRWGSSDKAQVRLEGQHGISKLTILTEGGERIFIRNCDLPRLKSIVESAMSLVAAYPTPDAKAEDRLPGVVQSPEEAPEVPSQEDTTFRVGDRVRCVKSDIDLTPGRVYGPASRCDDGSLEIIDDGGDPRLVDDRFVLDSRPPASEAPMEATPEVPSQEDTSIRVGDTVEIIGKTGTHHYLRIGSTATVVEGPTRGDYRVLGEGTVAWANKVQWVSPGDLRKVTTAAPAAPQALYLAPLVAALEAAVTAAKALQSR
ncbi:hypothetical protein NON00_02455 [Roseomonas sp. GC11]|uniref:hypothetical protein n=1 Tax=Roseomonas sp. GC11 TaxID=2950546 RepID=UPI0021086A74|nr:hypothetical protein [Roseomonas sp. GC11]MCQ4158789.1 hypothetical protein [Roseomonas sp. GC11]